MSYLNLNYFITLCEVQNLRQAAEHLRVSPQYLSHYVIELEKNYQVTLFYRKPRLCLTYEGELLLEAARDIQFYERNFESELQDISQFEARQLRLGCSSESLRMILPRLLFQYHQLHENVNTVIMERSEDKLLPMLEDGQLDLCLGIHLRSSPHTELLPLSHENIFLLVSDSLLRQWFPNDYPLCAERFNHGVRLSDFSELPFLNNLSEAYLLQAAKQYSEKSGIPFHYVLSSGSTEALMSLCQKGIGALLCTERYLPYFNASNSTSENYVYCFRVTDLPDDYNLDIAYAKNRHLPRYVITFIRCAQSLFNQETNTALQRREAP